MNKEEKPSVGDGIESTHSSWTFGSGAAKNFDDHVVKSVPLYVEGHDIVQNISEFFLPKGGRCLEVGCSTGTLISRLAEHHKDRDVDFLGIDTEEEMVEFASRNHSESGVEFVTEDVANSDRDGFDLIISYYTVQFIHPKVRQDVFNKIYSMLNWGGAFVLFEKVRAPDARFQDLTTQMYHDMKIGAGYSESQVMNKQRSLRGVLEPFSTQGNFDLLKRAGFVDYMTIFKYICFEGFVAIK